MQTFSKASPKIKKQLLESLQDTYCRLKPSTIEGVGVFAIRNIPKGVNPFKGIKQQKWYELNIRDLKGLDESVLEMIHAFFVVEENGDFLIPELLLNGMDISFFINNSGKPNVKTIDKGFTFITLRGIKKGEELTISYATYDDKWKK